MKAAKEINWGPGLFLIIYQIVLLAALPFYFWYSTLHLGTIVASIVLLYLTGMSITAGYHRYFSHKTYKANPIIEFLLLFFASMAAQGSALRWSFDHRNHHAFVDTDKDPYSIKKGFWYAHFLWLLDIPAPIDPKVVPDLIKNKMVTFQDKYCPLLMVGTNVLAFFIVGALTGDYWGAFFLASWLRIFCLHHFTWFINSLAHTWGDKPFSIEQSAVDNYLISLLTFGEGYHNYHHTYANDYRNGIRWYHFDPTKWLIWGLSKIGLAHGLKQMDAITVRRRMVIEHKNLLLEKLGKMWSDKKNELEKQVQDTANSLMDHINSFNALAQKYHEIKKDAMGHEVVIEVRNEIKQIKKRLKADWKHWSTLSRSILKMERLAALPSK